MEQNQQNAERLTDKAFSRLLLTSVLGILACLACLCSATWALFGAEVSNRDNVVEAGVFDLAVTVTDGATAAPLTVTEGEYGTHACTLAPGSYIVTLTVTDDTTVKGYCVVTVGGKSYKTASVNAEGAKSISFTLEVQNSALNAVFAPTWGLPAHTDVEPGGKLTLSAPQSAQ